MQWCSELVRRRGILSFWQMWLKATDSGSDWDLAMEEVNDDNDPSSGEVSAAICRWEMRSSYSERYKGIYTRQRPNR